jgi:2-polyprenyl-3-methyl-5-hydroxy-6-metoxy-1,4-benzoquinol methylase
MPDTDITRVTDETQDLYGREYWFSHMEQDLGHPNILTRARTDLSERCLYWLSLLLKYKLPPGRVLELGSSHGGFVAILNWVGFEATGLELSSWVVNFARNTFNVPILFGPIEDQLLEPHSFDIIVLMDVIEHLSDPVTTMRRCLSLLKPGGILLIQTPCLPETKTYAELVAEKHIFLSMLLKTRDHLYLFSQRSIHTFFTQLGYEYIAFEPPLANHDMLLVVGQSPLETFLPEVVERVLSTSPIGRLLQALLDLYQQNSFLCKAFAQKDEYIVSLQEALAQKETFIKTTLPAREEELASVKSVLQAREAELAALKNLLEKYNKILPKPVRSLLVRLR